MALELKLLRMKYKKIWSLNPCSNGMALELFNSHEKSVCICVLILVLMEWRWNALRVLLTKQQNLCLNPCSNGMALELIIYGKIFC